MFCCFIYFVFCSCLHCILHCPKRKKKHNKIYHSSSFLSLSRCHRFFLLNVDSSQTDAYAFIYSTRQSGNVDICVPTVWIVQEQTWFVIMQRFTDGDEWFSDSVWFCLYRMNLLSAQSFKTIVVWNKKTYVVAAFINIIGFFNYYLLKGSANIFSYTRGQPYTSQSYMNINVWVIWSGWDESWLSVCAGLHSGTQCPGKH